MFSLLLYKCIGLCVQRILCCSADYSCMLSSVLLTSCMLSSAALTTVVNQSSEETGVLGGNTGGCASQKPRAIECAAIQYNCKKLPGKVCNA